MNQSTAPTRRISHSPNAGEISASVVRSRVGPGLMMTSGRFFLIALTIARATASGCDVPSKAGRFQPCLFDHSLIDTGFYESRNND